MALTKVGSGVIQDDAVGIANLGATGTASSSTFLRGDNAWAAPTSSGFIGYTVYTATGTWTKATNNPTKIVVEVQGAGGGGGGGNASKGAGGGGGGYSRKLLTATDLANTTSADIAVGAAGTGGAPNGSGAAGGVSTFTEKVGTGGWTEVKGIGGGGAAPTYGNGGTSGVASGGDMHINGGTGGGNSNENNHGGGSFFTPMHYSITSGANPPTAGTGYGGGGEGSRGTSGYSGAAGIAGIVIVTEYK